MIEWWIVIGVVVALVIGAFVAGRVSSRRERVSTADLRYIRHTNGEIYLSSTDLAAALRQAGADDLADEMLGLARMATTALDNPKPPQ